MGLDVQYTVQKLTDDEIERRLSELEKRYGKSSTQFLLEYNSGQLGDNPDFIDWSGLLSIAGKVGLRRLASA